MTIRQSGHAREAARPERKYRYDNVTGDSARWDLYKPRPGDIIVCTPPKCGTTWTQMICALLIHQMPELPLPLTRLSRWLDRHTQPIETVIAEFDAQPYARVIKTHTPLDGLPYYDEVFYVVCGRDPRDALLSMLDHLANLSAETIAEANKRANMPADFKFPEDPNAFFQMFLSVGQHLWMYDGFPTGSILYFSETYWRFRHLPNIILLHYADLMTNPDSEMRRLSQLLGIGVDETRWPSLVSAASFASMKDHADETAPGAHLGEWTSNANFFRKARMNAWLGVLTPETEALYERVTREKLEPQLKSWLEDGRLAGIVA